MNSSSSSEEHSLPSVGRTAAQLPAGWVAVHVGADVVVFPNPEEDPAVVLVGRSLRDIFTPAETSADERLSAARECSSERDVLEILPNPNAEGKA